MRNKRGDLLHQVIIHIILIGLIFAVFFIATAEKVNARGVRQQVLEKQMALLIDSAVPGMRFELNKVNLYGDIENVKIGDGRIYVAVDGLASAKGYPFFTRYSVGVEETENKFVVSVK